MPTLSVVYYPALEMFALTTRFGAKTLLSLSPDKLATIAREDEVTEEQMRRIRNRWRVCQSHNDFYHATRALSEWAYRWPVDHFPDNPIDDRQSNDLDRLMPLKELAKHPDVTVGKNSLRNYCRTGKAMKDGRKAYMKHKLGTSGIVSSVRFYRDFISDINQFDSQTSTDCQQNCNSTLGS